MTGNVIARDVLERMAACVNGPQDLIAFVVLGFALGFFVALFIWR